MTALCGLAQNFWQLVLARVGVGIGEAGAIPPSQSLLADYYPPQRRAKALGFLLMSSMVGYMLGLVLGGWVAQHYGWRMAFIVVGLPGLALAVLAGMVLHEPRTLPQYAVRHSDRIGISTSIRELLAKPAYRCILAAMTLYFIIAYGAVTFKASFLVRVHQMSIAEVGMLIGSTSVTGALVGNIAGGYLADRLANFDVRWFARIPAIGLLVLFPIYMGVFLVDDRIALIVLLLVGSALLMGVVPPIFSAMHLVCGSRRRAMAVAVVGFCGNLIGLGLGPVFTGFMSDHFAVRLGEAEGLRQALLIVLVALLPSSYFMFRAQKNLLRDSEP